MTLIQKVAGGVLIVALLGSAGFLAHFYKERAESYEARLQAVTAELTNTRDEYERYVTEQTLIDNLVSAGAVEKNNIEVKTDEAIKEHRRQGAPVHVTGNALQLLQQRSREVRDAATDHSNRVDSPGSASAVRD